MIWLVLADVGQDDFLTRMNRGLWCHMVRFRTHVTTLFVSVISRTGNSFGLSWSVIKPILTEKLSRFNLSPIKKLLLPALVNGELFWVKNYVPPFTLKTRKSHKQHDRPTSARGWCQRCLHNTSKKHGKYLKAVLQKVSKGNKIT